MAGALDGQLRVRRGTDSPPWAMQMFDDELGLWLTLAQADELEDAMRAGIPVLRGPYVVDYTDMPHDGDSKVLWTPQIGDVLLRLFPDWQTVTEWDNGNLGIGQNPNVAGVTNLIAFAYAGTISEFGFPVFDLAYGIAGDGQMDSGGVGHHNSAYVFHSTDPLQIQMQQTGGADPAAGHVELYALVARAVAP